ncbi:MAG: hypothetical protein WA817_09990 [Candidatus Acidiferrum sp.]
MTNEQYLIVSYFCVALLSLAIGFGAYAWLRAPFHAVAKALPWKAVRELLVRLFPMGILLPALMGFITVRYIGCDVKNYAQVIARRPYLVSKNQEQISASLTYVIWAVCAWCAVVAILLAVKRRSDRRCATNSKEEI